MFGYSLFTLVLVLFSALVVASELNRRLEREADKGNRGVLAQVQIYGDSAVVGRIKSFVAEKFLDLSQDPSVMEFFSGEQRTASLIQVQKAVTALSLQGSSILSVQLYRRSDDTLVASDSGVSFHALDNPSQASPSYDGTLIQTILQEATEPRWIDPRANRPFWKTRSVLTYAQTVPLFSRGDPPLGCFLVNFDSQQLRNLLLTAKGGSYDFSLSIIDDEGRVMAAETQEDLDSPVWGLTLRNWSLRSDNGQRVTSLGGQEVAVAWSRSTLTNWKYFSITPLSRYREPLITVLQGVASLIAILSAAGLLIVNVLTFRLHAPLQRLVAKARMNLGSRETGEGDDWTVVDEALQKLSTQVSEIDRTLKDNAPLIERTLVEDLLGGRIGALERANERLVLVGKRLSGAPLRLVLLEWEPRTYEALPWDRRAFLSFTLQDRADRVFHREEDHLIAQTAGGGVVCLTGIGDDEVLVRAGRNLVSEVQLSWTLGLNVVVGEPVPGLEELSLAWTRSTKDREFGFFTGYGHVWLSRELAPRDAGEAADGSALKAWEAALRAGRSGEAEDRLFELLTPLRMGLVSPASGHRLLRQITASAGRIWEEAGAKEPALTAAQLDRALDAIRSLGEFREAFHGWLAWAAKDHEDRDSHLDRALLDSVTDWINGHLDRNLSLSMAAEHAGMGESHFSRWFKHALGIGFSEYVVQRKFDEAARRLAAGSTESIQQLARDLGYSDHSYFARLFKERFGMTPVQYRRRALIRR